MIDVHVDIDEVQMKAIKKRLGELESKAPTVLARAANRAIKTARKETWDTIKTRYFVKQKDLYRSLKITKNAYPSDPSAKMESKGSAMLLTEFKVKSTKRAKRKKRGGYSPDVFMAGVKMAGGVKPLSGNPKPFGTGHGHLAVRESGRSWPIRLLYGPAVPSMIKNEEVIGRVKEAAMEMLQKRIDAEINNILQGGK